MGTGCSERSGRAWIQRTMMCSMRCVCVQGWFPWFASAEQKQRTAVLRKRYEVRRAEADLIAHEQLYAEREANKQLGLFSTYGVGRAKENFWCGS
jgi:hypothetical protein